MGVDGFRFDLAAVLGNTCTRRLLHVQQDRRRHRAEPHRARDGAAPGRRRHRHRLRRRTLGHRRRHLPAGQLPERLVGVERQLPRPGAPGAERPRLDHRHHRPAGDPLRGLVRPVRRRRPPAVELGQLPRRARRLHARRPVSLQRLEQHAGLAVRPVRRRHAAPTTAGTRAAWPPRSARPRAPASR